MAVFMTSAKYFWYHSTTNFSQFHTSHHKARMKSDSDQVTEGWYLYSSSGQRRHYTKSTIKSQDKNVHFCLHKANVGRWFLYVKVWLRFKHKNRYQLIKSAIGHSDTKCAIVCLKITELLSATTRTFHSLTHSSSADGSLHLTLSTTTTTQTIMLHIKSIYEQHVTIHNNRTHDHTNKHFFLTYCRGSSRVNLNLAHKSCYGTVTLNDRLLRLIQQMDTPTCPPHSTNCSASHILMLKRLQFCLLTYVLSSRYESMVNLQHVHCSFATSNNSENMHSLNFLKLCALNMTQCGTEYVTMAKMLTRSLRCLHCMKTTEDRYMAGWLGFSST